MPYRDKYANWSIYDRDFGTNMGLDTSHYTDSALTGMFYDALHRIAAFLATKGHHYREHKQRKWATRRLFPSDLGTIEVDCSKLKQES